MSRILWALVALLTLTLTAPALAQQKDVTQRVHEQVMREQKLEAERERIYQENLRAIYEAGRGLGGPSPRVIVVIIER